MQCQAIFHLRSKKILNIKITILPKEEANIPTCLVCRKDNIPRISDYLKRMSI